MSDNVHSATLQANLALIVFWDVIHSLGILAKPYTPANHTLYSG